MLEHKLNYLGFCVPKKLGGDEEAEIKARSNAAACNTIAISDEPLVDWLRIKFLEVLHCSQ